MRLAGLAADPRHPRCERRARRRSTSGSAATRPAYSVQFARVLPTASARTRGRHGVEPCEQLERLAMSRPTRRSSKATPVRTAHGGRHGVAVLALVGIWAFRWARADHHRGRARCRRPGACRLADRRAPQLRCQRSAGAVPGAHPAARAARASARPSRTTCARPCWRTCSGSARPTASSWCGVGSSARSCRGRSPPRPRVDDGAVVIRRGLPLNTALGHARVADAQLEEVATELRRGLFVAAG